VAKPTAYIETSVVSYLVGWLNRDSLLLASNQALTREWWSSQRSKFELFASGIVIDEASKGDSKLAAERLVFLSDLPLLEVTAEARSLAERLLRETGIPRKAEIDAIRVYAPRAHGGLKWSKILSWKKSTRRARHSSKSSAGSTVMCATLSNFKANSKTGWFGESHENPP
jgi:hypothetical protein